MNCIESPERRLRVEHQIGHYALATTTTAEPSDQPPDLRWHGRLVTISERRLGLSHLAAVGERADDVSR
jgi:hypothetical protein